MTEIKKRDEINDFVRLVTDWRSMAIVHAVYEHDSLRYAQLDKLLAFSPTILSHKLSELVKSKVVARHKVEGAKEVLYSPTVLAKDIACAYHILEGVSLKLSKAHEASVEFEACKLSKDQG